MNRRTYLQAISALFATATLGSCTTSSNKEEKAINRAEKADTKRRYGLCGGVGRRGLCLPAAAFAGIQKTRAVLRAGGARGARDPGGGEPGRCRVYPKAV